MESGTLTGIRFPARGPDPAQSSGAGGDSRPFAEIRHQLDEYFAGRLREFDLALRMIGTPFQQAVWAGLLAIPYGETWSYARLATQIGRPQSGRAVGAACGSNPLSIVVPCHRVIGTNGRLTGFGGGLAAKRWLLNLEAGARPSQLWATV